MTAASGDLDPTSILSEWNLTVHREIRRHKANTRLFQVALEDGSFAVLKLYRWHSMSLEKEAPEFFAAMDGNYCAKLLRSAPRTLLIEYLEGEDLTKVVSRGSDDEATLAIIDIAEEVRRRNGSYRPKRDLPERYAALLDIHDTGDKAAADPSVLNALHVLRDLLSSATETRSGMLHGDLHHSNIIKSDRGWCAIDPITLFGEPEAEYAQIFLNPTMNFGGVFEPIRATRVADIIHSRTGFDKSRLLGWGVAKAAHKLVVKMKTDNESDSKVKLYLRLLDVLLEAHSQSYVD